MRALLDRVRRGPASVRLRVTGAATGLIALVLIVAAVGAVGLVRSSLTSDYDDLLASRVDEAAALISAGTLGPTIPESSRETGQLQVIDQRGVVIAETIGLATGNRFDVVAVPPMDRQASVTVSGARLGPTVHGRFRVLARTVAAADGPLTVYGATSLEPAARAEQHFAHVLMVGLPLLVLFAAALIWWGVGRALAPVEEMRSMVDRIETEALGRTEGSRPRQRVGVRRQGDEIGRLGATLNHLLDRLDDSARRQRVFAAAASHELRSPLSAIRTELEVGLAYPERTDWGVVAEESLIEVQRLEHLAADLLQLTRLQAGATGSEGGAAAESYDLADVVRGEVPRRQPPCGVELRTELRSAPVVADRDLLLQVLRNLLANAERHARSRVVTTTSRIADSAVLRVWNDGQPIADCDQERIFHPFTRLDDGRALDGGGSGLGLAIARAAAEQLGGTLTAVPVEHGAAFEATFPSSTEGGWG